MDKINSDITVAKTLSGDFYCSDEMLALVKEKIFETSWQFICSKDEINEPDIVFPFYLLESFISEPLIRALYFGSRSIFKNVPNNIFL